MVLDKTLRYRSGGDLGGLRDLVVTEVVGDGSCFFHSLLLAVSAYYKGCSAELRAEYVKRLRRTLAERFTVKKWVSLGKGEIATLAMLVNLRKKMERAGYKNIDSLLDNAYSRDGLEATIKRIVERSGGSSLSDFINDSLEKGYEVDKGKIEDPSVWVDMYLLEYLSDIFSRNFYFVTPTEVYAMIKPNIVKPNRKNVVFSWNGRNHFEIIGRIENNKIVRDFTDHDELIVYLQKIAVKLY